MNIAARLGALRSGDWEHKGWALVPAFISTAELDALRTEADRLFADRALFDERGAVPNSARRNDRLDPVIDVSPPFSALARDHRLLDLVNGLLGGEAQLLKDKFIAKPPGAPGYGSHQDAAYWPGLGHDPSRFLTAVLYLDDATAVKGAIECAAGHHHELLTDPEQVADPDEAALGPFTTVDARAGDLLLLHALTPHRSGPNRSDEMRRAILLTYGVDPRPGLYGIYHQLRAGMTY